MTESFQPTPFWHSLAVSNKDSRLKTFSKSSTPDKRMHVFSARARDTQLAQTPRITSRPARTPHDSVSFSTPISQHSLTSHRAHTPRDDTRRSAPHISSRSHATRQRFTRHADYTPHAPYISSRSHTLHPARALHLIPLAHYTASLPKKRDAIFKNRGGTVFSKVS